MFDYRRVCTFSFAQRVQRNYGSHLDPSCLILGFVQKCGPKLAINKLPTVFSKSFDCLPNMFGQTHMYIPIVLVLSIAVISRQSSMKTDGFISHRCPFRNLFLQSARGLPHIIISATFLLLIGLSSLKLSPLPGYYLYEGCAFLFLVKIFRFFRFFPGSEERVDIFQCPFRNMETWIRHLLTKVQQMKSIRSILRCCAWLEKEWHWASLALC